MTGGVKDENSLYKSTGLRNLASDCKKIWSYETGSFKNFWDAGLSARQHEAYAKIQRKT